eukprot:8552273-Pyramimonas_sp.AAC.1
MLSERFFHTERRGEDHPRGVQQALEGGRLSFWGPELPPPPLSLHMRTQSFALKKRRRLCLDLFLCPGETVSVHFLLQLPMPPTKLHWVN